MNKMCNFCGNKTFKEVKVQYICKHDGQFMIVNDVPCEQCEYCGEQYFKSNVLKKIENDFVKVHSNRKKVKEEIRVPVEQFACETE